jgi:diketogulonate reductase-like aldo/keto reductase
LAKPHVTSVLLGASKLSQLEDNLGALAFSLSPEEVERLDKLTAPTPIYPGWFQDATGDQKSRDALAHRISGRPEPVAA